MHSDVSTIGTLELLKSMNVVQVLIETSTCIVRVPRLVTLT